MVGWYGLKHSAGRRYNRPHQGIHSHLARDGENGMGERDGRTGARGSVYVTLTSQRRRSRSNLKQYHWKPWLRFHV